MFLNQLRNHLPRKNNPILPQARHNQPLKLLGPSPSSSKPRNTSIKPTKYKTLSQSTSTQISPLNRKDPLKIQPKGLKPRLTIL